MQKLALIMLGGLVVASCALVGVFGTYRSASAATSGVSVKSFRFTPATVNIKVGEAVRWINDETNISHDVTSEDFGGPLQSPALRPGESYSKTFDKAGAYKYLCIIHPAMRGIVLVGDATGAPTTPPPALAAAPISLELSGRNEVPPSATDGNGVFRATLSGRSLAFSLQAAGVGMTQAHIHVGAAGTNGPVVAFLFGPNMAGQNLAAANGTITPESLVGPLAGKWDDFAQALAQGNLYVNVHTIANPAGEFRAQIPASSAPRPPATGSGLEKGGGPDWPILPAMLGAGMALALAAFAVWRRGQAQRS